VHRPVGRLLPLLGLCCEGRPFTCKPSVGLSRHTRRRASATQPGCVFLHTARFSRNLGGGRVGPTCVLGIYALGSEPTARGAAMSHLVITLPADKAEWGPLVPVGSQGGMQTCLVSQGGQTVCQFTVVWPRLPPSVPMVSRMDARHAGEQD
jgi:hypothetical protein